MRGRERQQVQVALVGAGAASGALLGLVAGILWTLVGGPRASSTVAAALVATALGADVVWRIAGRPRPLSVRSQVPREWSALFAPVTTAALYGARLGVGPLTILPTWLWWAATAIAVSTGPAGAAATGATFAIARLVLVVAVSARVEGAMVEGMDRLRRRERFVVPAVGIVLVLVLVLGLVAGPCTSGGGGSAAPSTASTSPAGTGTTRAGAATTTPVPPATVPATVAPQPGDEQLAALLIDQVAQAGFILRTDPASTGPLDLAAAASFESDDSAERQLLETRGFQRGYIRSWSDGQGGGLVVEVYRFATAEGASGYQADGLLTLSGFGAPVYAMTEIPGAQGFSQIVGDSGSTTVPTTSSSTSSPPTTLAGQAAPTDVYGVAFTSGADFFLVLVSGPGSSATPDDARLLALTQAQKAGVAIKPGT